MKRGTLLPMALGKTLFLLILLGLFAIQLPITIATSYIVCAMSVLLNFDSIKFLKSNMVIFAITLCLFVFPTLTLNHGATPVFYLILTPFLFGAAYKFSRGSLDGILMALRSAYWIFFLLLCYGLIIHWGDPEPLGAIFPWASTNGFPSYLIVLQIAYSLTYFLKCSRLPLLSSFMTVVIAVVGLGRGSMIVGVAILFVSLFINLMVVKSKNDRSTALRIFYISSGPLMYFAIFNFENITDTLNIWVEGSKFAGGVLDEHRARMLFDYINKLDALQFLFGASYSNTSIDQIYGGNPHNSYIRVHSFYGLFGLLVVLFPFVAVALSRRDISQRVVFILLIALALIRASSEPIFFPSTLDFFYVIYFLLFFRFSKKLPAKAES